MFVKLMLWGQQRRATAWFNLGMAPLSGLENRSLAPLWNRVGVAGLSITASTSTTSRACASTRKNSIRNGSRRYLASPGGLALPRILTNLAALISGGLRGVISK